MVFQNESGGMMTKPAKKPKNMKGRPRGGASATCPVCGANSSVTLTRREGPKVLRWRECVNGHGFQTAEKVIK